MLLFGAGRLLQFHNEPMSIQFVPKGYSSSDRVAHAVHVWHIPFLRKNICDPVLSG